MKKIFTKFVPLAILPFLTSCNMLQFYGITKGDAPIRTYDNIGPTIVNNQQYSHFYPEAKQGNKKTRRDNSLLFDSYFRNGFNLRNNSTSNPYVARVLDYNGKRDTNCYGKQTNNAYWYLAPWWSTEFSDFKKDVCFEGNGSYVYKNEFRTFEVNPNEGSIRMQLNAAKENRTRFNGSSTIPEGATWSHSLIQTNFDKIRIVDYESIHITLDVEFDHICYQGVNSQLTNMECAQLMLYLSIFNDKSGPSMWYGLPIYDSRFFSTELYVQKDTGFEGATGKLIYNMPSSIYMGKGKPVPGKVYHIDVDILNVPEHNIYSAFEYGVSHDLIKPYDRTGIVFNYMNFGFEVPGPFDISMKLSNLDIYGIKK